MIPKKWGQGQLFAFSALDGEAYFSRDFTGTLTGDRIGVIFNSECRRTLYFGDVSKVLAPRFSCVTSDMIILGTVKGNMSMIFARKNLVVGEYCEDTEVFVSLGRKGKTYFEHDAEIHDSLDGDYTAIIRRDGRFAFSYADSKQEAVSLCEKGLALDYDVLIKERQSIYEGKSPEDKEYEALYSKCISVMKTQLYSPEGKIKRIWSTPDRLPHRNMWLWDSVFHAIGHRHLDTGIAQNLILAMLDVQREDGFIPHMANPDHISHITQPPVIAWGALLVYEKTEDREFLKEVYGKNKAFLLWCRENRRKSDKELYSWHTNPELNNRCDESGMDNSPRFDTESDLYAIDFSCFMANEARAMKKAAEILGYTDDADLFGKWFEDIKRDINSIMWCEDDGFYYDYDITCVCFNKVQSVSSFLTLFAGICDGDKTERLIAHLENPDEFGTEFPVPSISKNDSTFGTDMWRGPVWINYNYMIIKGLAEYGYEDKAQALKNKTLQVINEWYRRTGTVYEFYDSENKIPPFCFNRKGEIHEPYDFRIKYQSIRDYGWSITLAFDMLNS